MSNQENSNLQAAQDNTQNLTEEQLEDVTGGRSGSKWSGLLDKIKQCFGCGEPSPDPSPKNPNRVPSFERHAIMQQLAADMDKSPKPENWLIEPGKDRHPALQKMHEVLSRPL
jgi:hypothetical protein